MPNASTGASAMTCRAFVCVPVDATSCPCRDDAPARAATTLWRHWPPRGPGPSAESETQTGAQGGRNVVFVVEDPFFVVLMFCWFVWLLLDFDIVLV